MTQPKPKPAKESPKTGDSPKGGDPAAPGGKAAAARAQGGHGPDKADGAFDVWLTRGLHQLFDDIAREPVPDELLRLIEEDKQKKK